MGRHEDQPGERAGSQGARRDAAARAEGAAWAAGELQHADLRHLGHERVIGAWRIGDVIVDPGPTVCIEELLATVAREPPRAFALTHIHLDHAGATGVLLRHFPDAEVWVHEIGAPHIVDPSRLLASAARLYGESEMDRLWGEVAPVPAERVRALSGGERLGPGGDGPFRVAYTPGHARHHVSYLHEPTGLAFTGDVAGVRIGDGPVFAPTPPPDVDVDGWRRSLETIAAWRPAGLCLTHFGRHDKVDEHLARVWDSLRGTLELARTLDEQAFAAAQRAMMPQAAYAHATVPEHNWQGAVRFLRQQLQAGG